MMTIRILVTLQVFLVVLMIGYVRPVWADSVRGLFIAEKTCPAYVSKNKKTNPDQTQITMGESMKQSKQTDLLVLIGTESSCPALNRQNAGSVLIAVDSK